MIKGKGGNGKNRGEGAVLDIEAIYAKKRGGKKKKKS